jgi:hypothetical protein
MLHSFTTRLRNTIPVIFPVVIIILVIVAGPA